METVNKKGRNILENAAKGSDIRAIVAQDALDHDEYERGYLSDVSQHGCMSGMCSGLIYYTDTVAFYDKHEDEIEDMLFGMQNEHGHSNRLEAIASLNGADLVGSITQEKNLLAWFAYEQVAYFLLAEIEHN